MSASGAEPTALAEPDAVDAGQPQDNVPIFQRFMERIGQFWTLGVLALLIIAFGIAAPSLYTERAWQSTAGYAVEYLILAIGQTFVIITAGIDLSVGAMLGFSGMAGALVAQHMLGVHDNSTLTTIVTILVMLGAGTGLGLINGLLITRINLPPFIVTLGSLTGITGGINLLNGGNEVATLPSPINALGTDSILNGWLPLPVLIAIVFAIVFGLVLARTRFGLRTYAIGSNVVAARRAGIRVDRHLVWVYTLTGFLAGVAGLMVTADLSTASPINGQNDELYAIAAVFIGGASIFGGTGTIFGTVIGTAILSVLTTGLVLVNVQPFWQQVAIGAVVIVAVAVDRIRARAGTD